jgi:hypothetical protein
MGDLISRKEVMKFLSKKNKDGMPYSSNNRAIYCFIENLIDEIRDDIPTAYDVDKVTKQIKRLERYSFSNLVKLPKVIEIVKGAVKDE